MIVAGSSIRSKKTASKLAKLKQGEPFVESIQWIGAGIFAIAVLHTFSTKFFEHLAHTRPQHAGVWHLLGEVEVVFGFWAIILVAVMLASGIVSMLMYRAFIGLICAALGALLLANGLLAWVPPEALSNRYMFPGLVALLFTVGIFFQAGFLRDKKTDPDDD